MSKFIHKSVVTIGDTNCFGNVYFLNCLKLSGAVRELWVGSCVKNAAGHLAGGLLLATRNVSCDFIKDYFLFDPIRCEMNVRTIKHASAELEFRFYHDQTNELHAQARHTIVFADRSHKICPILEDFRRAALEIVMRPDPSQAGDAGENLSGLPAQVPCQEIVAERVKWGSRESSVQPGNFCIKTA